MSLIYKVLVQLDSGKKAVFATETCLENFNILKEEIFIRMPELKNKSFKFFYEDFQGYTITIYNDACFKIFFEQKITKISAIEDGISDRVPIQAPFIGDRLGFHPSWPMVHHAPGFPAARLRAIPATRFANPVDYPDSCANYVVKSATAAANAAAAVIAESTSNNAPKIDQIVASMDGVHLEQDKRTESQASKRAAVMTVDCSANEGNSDFSKQTSRGGSSESNQPNKSVSAGKDAADRSDWAFISATDIDDTAQASSSPKSTSATPKRPTPPPQTEGAFKAAPLNFGQFSGQSGGYSYITEMNRQALAELFNKMDGLKVARASANRMGENLKASGAIEANAPAAPIAIPTAPTHETNPYLGGFYNAPTALRREASMYDFSYSNALAVQTMVAMGFSNEGGRLDQLLEAVNGDLRSAIDLLTQHK